MYLDTRRLAVMVLIGLCVTPAQADYAIAFVRKGKHWAYGSNYGERSIEEARKLAIANCDMKGCKVVAYGRNQCAAIAISPNGGAGWAAAAEMSAAREQALVACSEVDRRCTIRTSFCDQGGSAEVVPSVSPAPPPPPVEPRSTGNVVRDLKERLRSCVNLNDARYGSSDTVRLVLGFDDEGKLAFPPTISSVGSGSNAGAFATRLILALNRCAPYNTIAGVAAASFKNITIDFSPTDFR